MRIDRRGSILLEVLLALVLLGTVGLSALHVIAESAASESRLASREREVAEADRLLRAHSLLLRRDLELRLGTRRVGTWLVDIQRPTPALYRVSLAHESAPEVEVLVTVLFRPATHGS